MSVLYVLLGMQASVVAGMMFRMCWVCFQPPIPPDYLSYVEFSEFVGNSEIVLDKRKNL
jgi:hypothetical protein